MPTLKTMLYDYFTLFVTALFIAGAFYTNVLKLTEQISLMSRLASIIEKQTFASDKAGIKTKKIKKIPDADYNRYLNADEAKAMRNASLANIREILKNDEWS